MTRQGKIVGLHFPVEVSLELYHYVTTWHILDLPCAIINHSDVDPSCYKD